MMADGCQKVHVWGGFYQNDVMVIVSHPITYIYIYRDT